MARCKAPAGGLWGWEPQFKIYSQAKRGAPLGPCNTVSAQQLISRPETYNLCLSHPRGLAAKSPVGVEGRYPQDADSVQAYTCADLQKATFTFLWDEKWRPIANAMSKRVYYFCQEQNVAKQSSAHYWPVKITEWFHIPWISPCLATSFFSCMLQITPLSQALIAVTQPSQPLLYRVTPRSASTVMAQTLIWLDLCLLLNTFLWRYSSN